MLAGDVVRRVGTAISDAFWVVFYFFYYLVAPRPEWKCDRCTASVQKNCCVEVRKNEQSGEKRESQKSTTTPSSPTKWSSGAPRGFQKKSYWASFKEWCRNAANTVGLYARRVGRFCYSVLCKVARVLRTILQYLWAILKALFWSDIESKSLPPSAPKPFQIKPPEDSPTFNKVEFNPNEIVESLEKEKAVIEPILEEAAEPEQPPQPTATTKRQPPLERLVMSSYSNEPVLAPAPAPDSGPAPAPAPRQFVPAGAPETSYDAGPSTYPRKFTDTSLDTREDAAMERWDRESNDLHAGNEVTAKREPPGIGKLPADVMAELHGTQKMRQERERETSVQREMTQSCHPDMAQWNAESRYDRSATATPYRASSVGPTMRKLEQVVSRLEDSSDNEARYVFRAKPSDYMMGKSVFTPLEEAERMRDTINRTSRPVTPAHSVVSGRMTPYAQDTSYGTHSYRGEEDVTRRRARTVGPIGRESAPRTSGFYATSPVASHTVRRTPVPYDRGANFAYDRDQVTQGAVTSQVRRWPPASNASGAEVTKDDWVEKMVRENDDGLITTMCRRVVERKVEDSWKWRDERGQLLDEKNQRTWKGELDTVLRDGPGEARHWSRTVELLPTGDTRFQDVSRQYNRNYVVESIVRNY